jgi:hypothetical protein
MENANQRTEKDYFVGNAFYKNGPDGKINWREPYKQIKAITEHK